MTYLTVYERVLAITYTAALVVVYLDLVIWRAA